MHEQFVTFFVLTAIQQVHYSKNVFVWLHKTRLNFQRGSASCFHIHFGKVEAAYRRPCTDFGLPKYMVHYCMYVTSLWPVPIPETKNRNVVILCTAAVVEF